VLDGVPDPPGEGEIWESNANKNMQLQIAAKPSVLCCCLATSKFRLSV